MRPAVAVGLRPPSPALRRRRLSMGASFAYEACQLFCLFCKFWRIFTRTSCCERSAGLMRCSYTSNARKQFFYAAQDFNFVDAGDRPRPGKVKGCAIQLRPPQIKARKLHNEAPHASLQPCSKFCFLSPDLRSLYCTDTARYHTASYPLRAPKTLSARLRRRGATIRQPVTRSHASKPPRCPAEAAQDHRAAET